MSKCTQTRLLLACMVACAWPVAAQEASCDADPRWLAVTVLQSRMSHDGKEAQLAGGQPFRDFNLGVQMLDRCVGDLQIGSTEGGTVLGVQTSVVIQQGTTTTVYYVRESVQDICAAVSDCADAIRESQQAVSP